MHRRCVMEDRNGWRDAQRYGSAATRFGRVEWRVTQAAREALAALEGHEADTLRLAEAIGMSRLREEDPELWRVAEELTAKQRIEAFKLAVNYLEDGESHALAIRRAIRRIKSGAR